MGHQLRARIVLAEDLDWTHKVAYNCNSNSRGSTLLVFVGFLHACANT